MVAPIWLRCTEARIYLTNMLIFGQAGSKQKEHIEKQGPTSEYAHDFTTALKH